MRPNLPILAVLSAAILCATAPARGDLYGNDVCIGYQTCYPLDPSRICGFGAAHPPAPPETKDGPIELSAYDSFRQGTYFNHFYTWCNIVWWEVWIETTGGNPRAGSSLVYSGSQGPHGGSRLVPVCHPPGESIVRFKGLGPHDDPPLGWHHRRSEPFQVLAGSQACVYSASIPGTVLQGGQTTVSWDAPYNQYRFELWLYRADGSQVGSGPVASGNSGQQSAVWTVDGALAPGRYRIEVRTRNGAGEWRDRRTNEIEVRPRPTVTNVTAAPATIFAGSPLNVTWSSTNQSSWALYRCDSSGSSCAGPVLASDGSNGAATQTDWLTPLTPTGSYRIKVRVANSTSGATAEALSNLVTIEARPTITVRWEFWNTSIAEAGGSLAPRIRVITSNGQPTLDPVSATFRTESDFPAPGAAAPGSDYSHREGQIAIAAGTPSGTTLPIPNPIVIGQDVRIEPEELFRVHLLSVTGLAAQLGTPDVHEVAIVDDDVPTLAIDDLQTPESGTASVRVRLSEAPYQSVTVSYATVATGSAQAGADFQPVSGALTFPAGSAAPRTVAVPIVVDPIREGDESFLVRLSSPQNATLADAEATVVIQDDDPVPTLSLIGATIAEGNSATTPVTVTFQLSNPTVHRVTGSWTTVDGSATAPADYLAASGTIDIAPLATAQSLVPQVVGDTIDELDVEAFRVDFVGVSNASPVSGSTTVAIQDDDPVPSLSLAPAAASEGDTGASPAVFQLTLSEASGRTVRVAYSTASGAAVAGSDFHATIGTATLRPGETGFAIPVAVIGDRAPEADESFSLTLSAPVNAVLASTSAAGSIVDDDAGSELTVGDRTVVESPTTIHFEIAGRIGAPRTVRYETEDGAALAGLDYEAISGELTVPPAPGRAEVKVRLLADAALERPESFSLVLRDPIWGDEIARGATVIVDAAIGGDFDRNGSPDLFWRDTATGANEAWLMAGRTRGAVEPTDPATLATEWRLVGTADFDGDGGSDLLWRSATAGQLVIWYLDGLVAVGGETTVPDGTAVAGWEVVGTGDFDDDGGADIVWQNPVSGKIVVWRMSGNARTSGDFTVPDGVGHPNWRLSGVGDLDADGHPDLLFRNTTSGRAVLWRMNGLERVSGTFVTPHEADLDWEIAAVADLTQDGRADIVWRHRATGALRVWAMDGDLRLAELPTSPEGQPDLSWSLRGPR